MKAIRILAIAVGAGIVFYLLIIAFLPDWMIVGIHFRRPSRHAPLLEGTLQTGPEQSAFFPDGDCSKKPFWFNWPDQFDDDLNARLRALGKPAALRLKLIGDVSQVGNYGHLGGYPREVQAIRVISVDSATPCPWPGER
jgi:hypothetical protein